MVKEAKLVSEDHGLRAEGEGWYIVNAADCSWIRSPDFGRAARFEGKQPFAHLGVHIHVLEPGQPACYYHRETMQEDFLVLFGSCLVIIDGEERALEAWDFVHCPPETDHVFVGAGDGPCAILMMGARSTEHGLHYPVNALAQKHGACAAAATDNPREAYKDIQPREAIPSPWKKLLDSQKS